VTGTLSSHILVVEDESGLADILRVNLEGAGFRVELIGDGIAALHRLSDPPPDLVILDLNLPGVSGFRLMELIRRPGEWEQVPVVVLTAYSFQEAEEAATAGADGFITKPFTPEELLAQVRAALDRRQGRFTAHDP
jgi:DNA-binding response OmpR family regulator